MWVGVCLCHSAYINVRVCVHSVAWCLCLNADWVSIHWKVYVNCDEWLLLVRQGRGSDWGRYTFRNREKKPMKSDLIMLSDFFFLFCFICLVPGYNFITPPTNYLLTFFLLCGVYVYSWSQFTLMLLDYLNSSLKIKRTVFFFTLLVACDIRLWSHFSGSILLPAGHFRSGLQLPHFHPHSLGSPSICIPPLTTSCLHSPTLCGSLLPDALTETSPSYQQPSFWHQ